jgi:hypothetical protein
MYASSLMGEYLFDATSKKPKYIVKDQSNATITTLLLDIKAK